MSDQRKEHSNSNKAAVKLGPKDKPGNPSDARHGTRRYFNVYTALLATLGAIVTYFLCSSSRPMTSLLCSSSNDSIPTGRPKYVISCFYLRDEYMKHPINVLDALGLERIENVTGDWDLMWAHEFPFPVVNLTNLNPHQLVNHIPSIGILARKVELVTSTKKPYVPPAFRLPQQEQAFKEYAEANPGKLFVQKQNTHRQVRIKKIEDIDYSDGNTFIQQYVDDPLLVDGHKFDFGVFVVITSLDPLRVYMYDSDCTFGCCRLKYHPFNATDVDKYVIGKGYLTAWEVPSFDEYFNKRGYGKKDSLNAHLRATGRDPSIIWEQVEDAIRDVVLLKEPMMIYGMRQYPNKRNFFELMRFDFIIDDTLKVHLVEANMSPNLASINHQQNSVQYEQVIYHTLRLVGVGSEFQRESFAKRQPEVEAMKSVLRNIATNANRCSSYPCAQSCIPEQCKLCTLCLSEDDQADLHAAYREHMNRGDLKRLFPPPKVDSHRVNYDSLSTKNKLMYNWYASKCETDATYC